MIKSVVETINLTKTYKTGKTSFTALSGVNIKIRTGEFVSILGPSGSGKSTLLQLIGCLDKPTTGEVVIDGIRTSSMDDDELAELRNNKLGFVFQTFNLVSTMSVFKNIEMPLMIQEIDKSERREQVEKLLEKVGLSSKSNNKPSELSGGEKQRIAIARALANDPPVILADEPTGNLDSKNGKNVMEFFSSLWKKEKRTLILVTHEPNVAAYSQRSIYVRDGMIEKEVEHEPRKFSSHNIKDKGDE